MAGPLDELRDPKNDPNLARMGAEIPAPIQGQLLLDALARAASQGKQQSAPKANPKGKDVDVGMLLQRLLDSTSTESPRGVGDKYKFQNQEPGHDELQPEINYKRM